MGQKHSKNRKFKTILDKYICQMRSMTISEIIADLERKYMK